ncbi:hypothetical protein, partial [Roseomonas mucosa]|uniref:hypothetical protein n=1 Tax=Roseomonas mucosa TaxID=207340 RepID=UPI001EF6B481
MVASRSQSSAATGLVFQGSTHWAKTSRLLDEMPREQVPTLVFAGRVGWLVADLMQQLENAE